MRQVFHYDFFSLKDVDIPQWTETFFWPVARETTTRITVDFHAKLKEMVNELGQGFAGDCLLIGWQLSNNFIRGVNHYLGLHRLQEKGYDVSLSNRLKLIPLLQGKEEYRLEPENLRSLVTEGHLKSFASNLLKSFYVNIPSGRFGVWDHFRRNDCRYAFPNENVRNRPYIRNLANWVRITSAEEWLNGGTAVSVPPSVPDEFKAVAEGYLSFVKEYAIEHFGVSLPGNLCRALFQHAVDTLEHVSQVYSILLKKVERSCPRYLLTPTAGKTFIRALSLAVKNHGGEVTGFPHSYFICHYSSPRPSLHELSTVDRFMAYSPGSVGLFERNLSLNPPARNNPVRIVHENTPIFKDQWEHYRDKPLPTQIKTVMVLELSLIAEWAGYYAVDAMVNYDFYYRLCKTLAGQGYKVIFKKRPKSLKWDGVDVFKDIDHVTVTDIPFEAPGLMDQADAIFCQYAMSSTLYWSMCTNKTVVYVDAGWEPWFQDVYDLMAKRCRILHCWYDERNRQCFDEEELLSVLRKPPGPPNTEFIEKYLFPRES